MASATEAAVARCSRSPGAGALAAQMFTAVDSEIPPGPPDIPKLLDVLKRNGVTVAEPDVARFGAAFRAKLTCTHLDYPFETARLGFAWATRVETDD